MLNIDDRLIKEVSPKIGPNALSTLLAIAIHLNQKTNRCFPSHHRLMELTGMGKNAVYDALNVLKEVGLLRVEQSVNSKKNKFGRREFIVDTNLIGVFVSAKDLSPLPDLREPQNREPQNREPQNRETYQINNTEQINQFEQINEVDENASPSQSVETFSLKEEVFKKDDVPPAAPPPAPLWQPFTPSAELQKMRSDFRCKERFQKETGLPETLYETAIDNFALVAETIQHSGPNDLRQHFFNWSRKPEVVERLRPKAQQARTPYAAPSSPVKFG